MKQNIFIIIGILAIIGIGAIVLFFVITSKLNQENTLKTARVNIRNSMWEVEVAETLVERARGLSYRESLGKNKGMLFIFDQPSREFFWMKGMNFPLDMIWIRDKKIIDITKNAQPLKDNLRPLYYTPKEPADMVLEINAGQADQSGVQIGDEVRMLNN